MKTVTIIDYGMSNLRSVSKALERVADADWQVQISAQPETILKADKIVFPGQGAIGNCMSLLSQTGLDEVLKTVLATKPFLGICLGLQSLLTFSQESGGTAGLNWISGHVNRFPEPLFDPTTRQRLKVPQMGWSQVQQTIPHFLWTKIPDHSRFYFVHSYYVTPEHASILAGTTQYGNITYASAIAKDNVFAVQFHPEKSQQLGLSLLSHFLQWSI